MRLKRLKICTTLLMLIFAIFLSGCVSSSGNFAKLRHDNQITKSFENFEVNPEYQYFYTGRDKIPSAIVGISKKYKMESKLWRAVDLTPEQLHQWIFIMANRIYPSMQEYGSKIIGPNGEVIGVWYSLEDWQQWARIEIVDPNIVKIGSPSKPDVRKRRGMNL